MERLVVNLTGRARKATLNGREYLVAPASLIVPGVLDGSRGPGLYTAEENRRNVDAWNGIPILVYHANRLGVSISARDPDIIDSQGVGTVYRANAKVDGKLSAEVWFDVAALDRIDAKLSANVRIRPRLESGEPIELSTGLNLDPEPADGTFGGRSYTFVARNYRPDHLAILPDQIGACSLGDGCGVLVNGRYDLALVTNALNQNEEVETMAALTTEQRTELVNGLIANCDCWDEGDLDVLNGLSDEKLTKLTENVAKPANNAGDSAGGGDDMATVLKGMSDEELDAEMKRRSSGKKATDNANNEGTTDPEEPVTAEQWLNKAPEEVKNTFRYAHQIEQEQKESIVSKLTANIEDNAEKRIHSERLMQRSLEDLRNDLVLMPEAPAGQATSNTGSEANEDGKWLSSMVSRLGREPDEEPLMPPTISWGDKPADNSGQPAIVAATHGVDNPEQWLKTAPAGVKSLLENAMRIEHRERDELVSKLVSNVEDTNQRFRLRDKLENKPLLELREMLELIPKGSTSTMKPNYTGAAAPATNTRMSDEDREDILPLPTMNLSKQA